MSVVIIIPARYQSSRFPGKPLAKLLGKTLIQRTYETGQGVDGVDQVYVATDDERIRQHVESFGGQVLMTSSDCRNGTERVYEAVQQLPQRPDIAINLQGDAPLTPPGFIEALISEMQQDETVLMSTPVLRCDAVSYQNFVDDRKAGRVGATTVVFDNNRNALYFSKEIVPYIGTKLDQQAQIPVFHHVGLYAFRFAALEQYASWQPGPLEQLEGLEQLRFLENGTLIRAVVVDSAGKVFWEVNNPEDIERVEKILAA